jgi:hypothetical protein
MNRPAAMAVAVVLLSNAWALIQAARNRMGEPEAAVEISERELRLNAAREGRSHRYVTFNWNYGISAQPDEQKMAELGFDTGPAGQRAAYRQPIRQAYAAIEIDGPSWRISDKPGWMETPRAVVLDVDRDPARLRARHPNRSQVLILRVLVRAGLEGERLRGWVAGFVPNQISAPTGMLDGIQPAWPVKDPRYALRVAVGRNYEPYITAIRRLTP